MIVAAAAFDCPQRNAPAAVIDGEIRGVSIERSSGSAALDAAARAGAAASTFATQCKDGRAVASRYRYVTTFEHPRRAQ